MKDYISTFHSVRNLLGITLFLLMKDNEIKMAELYLLATNLTLHNIGLNMS